MDGKVKLTTEELERRLTAEFPQMLNPKPVTASKRSGLAAAGSASISSEGSLRPGGTIAGTTMMTLADFAPYVAILASIGWVPLAVTVNLSINFLRKPAARDLFAEARLIKLGKRLAVADIGIRSEGQDDLVAHAIATYSIPPHAVK